MSQTSAQNPAERAARAADRMYCAEVALHAAFETHVDGWIAAAYDRLHEAIAEHTAALHDCAA